MNPIYRLFLVILHPVNGNAGQQKRNVLSRITSDRRAVDWLVAKVVWSDDSEKAAIEAYRRHFGIDGLSMPTTEPTPMNCYVVEPARTDEEEHNLPRAEDVTVHTLKAEQRTVVVPV